MREHHLRWYLGRADVERDAQHLAAGGPLALVGGRHDDLAGFADRLASERPVIDLRKRTPSARALREFYAEHPETIVLAHRPDHVIGAIGLIAQPWYMVVSSLGARPNEALSLLRQAIEQLGVIKPLDALGAHAVSGLRAYTWPRGLRELRQASWRIAAILTAGNVSAGARSLDISRQALAKYLSRRFTSLAADA
jgi:hypothetical protein